MAEERLEIPRIISVYDRVMEPPELEVPPAGLAPWDPEPAAREIERVTGRGAW